MPGTGYTKSCFRHSDFFSICFTSIWRTYFIFLSDVQRYFIFKHIFSRLCIRHTWDTYKILLAVLDTRILFLAEYARALFFFFFFTLELIPMFWIPFRLLCWIGYWNGIFWYRCVPVYRYEITHWIYIYIYIYWIT